MQQGLVVRTDFSQAYDLVHHNYFVAFFHIGLPVSLIFLLISMFKAQFIWAVGMGSKRSCSPPNPKSNKGTPSPQRSLKWFVTCLYMRCRQCRRTYMFFFTWTTSCCTSLSVHNQCVDSYPGFLSTSDSLVRLWG